MPLLISKGRDQRCQKIKPSEIKAYFVVVTETCLLRKLEFFKWFIFMAFRHKLMSTITHLFYFEFRPLFHVQEQQYKSSVCNTLCHLQFCFKKADEEIA